MGGTVYRDRYDALIEQWRDAKPEQRTQILLKKIRLQEEFDIPVSGPRKSSGSFLRLKASGHL